MLTKKNRFLLFLNFCYIICKIIGIMFIFAPQYCTKPFKFSFIMEVCIFSVTTAGEDNKPLVKRFNSLEKALEHASKFLITSESPVLLSNESFVLED